MSETAISPRTIFDELPGEMPPAAALLGWDVLKIDEERETIRIAFEGKPEFTSPSGFIQGGFLTAMLDEAMGSILTAVSKGTQLPATMSMTIDFARPALPGRLIGEGRITQKGREVIFLEGKLFDANSKLIARSTACSKILKFPKP